MRKRILFVDDEPLVLSGMQRTLRGLREEWDMEFVGSGNKALELMAVAPFDVVVTDMHMPGTDGAELLAEVMLRHPATIRIILSGHSDKDLILKCVNSTHLYLAKPCESEALKSAIQRACGLENEKINKLLARMQCLPSVPALYLEMVEKLNDPKTTIEDIGAIVGKDLAMTAQMLRLVNSAFFGPSRPMSSPFEAALYLGIDTIESLVLSIHTFSQFSEIKSRSFNLEELMRHSMSTAARAKKIARLEGADAKSCNDCFVAGMLHDAGKLMLAANFPEEYERSSDLARAGGYSACAAELEIFGADHASLGGCLLGLWGLPLPVVEAISLHHLPRQGSSAGFSILTAVHAGNALEHESAPSASASADHQLDKQYLASLGLAHRVDAWRQSGQNHETREMQL